ncbi:MAG: VTC domain-containing protein [Gemmatimonadota bacterium]
MLNTHTFNRFELKYLVRQRVIPEFLGELAGYLRPDPNATGPWGYPVFSAYWDSDAFALFWEKIEGLKYRRKLRFRRYGDEPFVFIEIKQRTDRTLQKRRARWPLTRTVAAFGPDSDHGPIQPDDPIVSEALVLKHRFRLRPRMAISYRRRAYFGVYEPDLRVTFDHRVLYRATEVDIARPVRSGRDLIDPRLAIMEVKFDERVPTWLGKAVRRHGFQMVRLSKYCSAVDRTYFGNTLT